MSDGVIVALIMAGSVTVPSILQFISLTRTKRVEDKLQAVHDDVNGSLAAMRTVELKAERILGIAEGRALERAERAERAEPK